MVVFGGYFGGWRGSGFGERVFFCGFVGLRVGVARGWVVSVRVGYG